MARIAALRAIRLILSEALARIAALRAIQPDIIRSYGANRSLARHSS
ncbi:hypothetical protein [Neobacillus notoginsengisoli]|nr:hypothetical protein [Neobacillus notoginsengisoli]